MSETFIRLRETSKQDEHHRLVLKLLYSLEEAITTRNNCVLNDISPVEYLGSILSGIETCNRNHLSLYFSLLKLLIPTLTVNSLLPIYTQILPVLNKVRKNIPNNITPSEHKSVYKTFANIIKIISADDNIFKDDQVIDVFTYLFQLNYHKNHNVRKSINKYFKELFYYLKERNINYPIIELERQIRDELSRNNNNTDNLIAIFNLLSSVPLLFENNLSHILEYSVQYLSISDDSLILSILRFYITYFKEFQKSSYATKLYEILLSRQFTSKNSECLKNYSYILYKLLQQLHTDYLFEPTLYSKLLSFFLLPNNDLHTELLKIFELIFKLYPLPILGNNIDPVLESFNHLFSVHYQATWAKSLLVLAHFFNYYPNFKPNNKPSLLPISFMRFVSSFIGIRTTILLSDLDSMASFNFTAKSLILNIGIDNFNNIIPFISGSKSISIGIPDDSLWILDLFEVSCKLTWGSVHFFKETVYPLIIHCIENSRQTQRGDLKLSMKKQSIRLFRLLPCLLIHPLDLIENSEWLIQFLFDNLQKPIETEFPPFVCECLTNILKTEHYLIVRKYMNDFLTLVYKLYDNCFCQVNNSPSIIYYTDPISHKDILYYDTFLQSIMILVASDEVKNIYTGLMIKLLRILATNLEDMSMSDQRTLVIMMSLIKNYIPYIKDDILTQIYNPLMKLLLHDNETIQKAIYLFLIEVMNCKPSFINETIRSQILLFITEGIAKTKSGTRKYRIKFISSVFKVFPITDYHLLISDILFGLKDSNQKIRKHSERTLFEVADQINSSTGSLASYFTLLLVGFNSLISSVQSSSIMAMTISLMKYRDDPYIEQLLYPLTKTIESIINETNYPEVTKASLIYIKYLIKIYSKEQIQTLLEVYIPLLMKFLLINSGKCRILFRRLLNKFIKKAGLSDVEKYVPRDKLHLFHTLTRDSKKRKRKEESSNDESNTDEIDEIDEWFGELNLSYKENLLHKQDENYNLLDNAHLITKSKIEKTKRNNQSDMEIDVNNEGQLVFNNMEEINENKTKPKKLIIKTNHSDKNISNHKRESSQKPPKIKSNNSVEPYKYIKLDPRDLTKKGRRNVKLKLHNLKPKSKSPSGSQSRKKRKVE